MRVPGGRGGFLLQEVVETGAPRRTGGRRRWLRRVPRPPGCRRTGNDAVNTTDPVGDISIRGDENPPSYEEFSRWRQLIEELLESDRRLAEIKTRVLSDPPRESDESSEDYLARLIGFRERLLRTLIDNKAEIIGTSAPRDRRVGRSWNGSGRRRDRKPCAEQKNRNSRTLWRSRAHCAMRNAPRNSLKA